jgi:hypothetical protein
MINKIFSDKAKVTYILAVILIFFWKTILVWRGYIDTYFQDEELWFESSKNYNLLEYSTVPDSGYFTPILRSVAWIIYVVFEFNPTALHTFSAFIASACCASIIILSPENSRIYFKTVCAFILGTYPSFDLLLYFNLSYYLFIPTLLLTLKINQNFSKKTIICLSLMILSLGKPQLLVSILLVLLFKLYQNPNFKKSYFSFILIFLTVILLVLSRINPNPINLEIANQNFLFGLFALFQMPATLLFPIISIAFKGFLELQNLYLFLPLVEGFKIFSSFAIIYILVKKKYRLYFYANSKILGPLILAIIPTYVSLFIFSNSGWSTNFFWNINCTICLYNRHFFPLIVISTIIMSEIFGHLKIMKLPSLFVLFQYLGISLIAYNYLFLPI